MKRILITGAGGSPAVNFIRSLREAPEKFYLVGTDADKYYLMRSETNKRYLVPRADDPSFLKVINKIIEKEKIDFIHAQNDGEVNFLSQNRERINAKTFLPSKQTVELLQDKFLSFKKWREAGIKVPKTVMIHTPADLKKAFSVLGGRLWIRAIAGAGGKGSLPVHEYKTAKTWIDFHNGWGSFSASELLEPHTITWMSLWHNGKLVVAQGRKRLYWELSKISPSGVTGATGGGETVSDKRLDKIAIQTIEAVDKNPHGLFGVDLTYDAKGLPNPTEINIGRFFTTHQFFTEAGLNMPYIFTKLAYGEKAPKVARKLNPVKNGLVWIRGIDFEPVLTSDKEIEQNVCQLEQLKKQLR